MDINKRMQLLRSSTPEILQGVLRMSIEGGEVTFRPADNLTGRKFNDVSEAVAYVRAQGLTGAQLMDSPYTSRNIPGYIREVEKEVKKLGGRVERFQYDLADEYQLKQFERIYKRGDDFFGWLTPDDTSTYIRAYHASGEEMTHAEFASVRRGAFGEVVQDPLAAKAAKRQKQLVVSKPFEMMTQDPLNIGIFDVTHNLELDEYEKRTRAFLQRNQDDIPAILREAKVNTVEEFVQLRKAQAADIAADGFSLGSMEFFEMMVDETMELRKTLASQEQIAMSKGDFAEARRLRREVELLDTDIQKLKHSIKNNSTYNIRASGLKALAVPGQDGSVSPEVQAVIRRMEAEGWTLKGNIQPDPSGYVASRGVHVLTHRDNIKFELGFTESALDAGRTMRSQVTLNPFYHSHGVVIDLQTIASNPEIFTREFIDKMATTQMQGIEEAIATARRGEGIPAGLRATLESMARGELDEAPRPEIMRKARNVLKAIDSGMPFDNDPFLMNQLLDVLQDSSVIAKGAFDMPKLTIPGAQRGEITPAWAERIRLGAAAPQLAPGEIRFDARAGTWVMHDSDIATFRASLGGFDLDDALNGVYRYDVETGKIRLLGIRQPNSRYEQINLNLAASDDFIMQVVGQAKKEDAYKNALDMVKTLDKENADINLQLRRNIPQSERQYYQKMLKGNQKKQATLERRIGEILAESMGEYKEIRRASGGIVGEKIPTKRIDASGVERYGFQYELADGGRSPFYETIDSTPSVTRKDILGDRFFSQLDVRRGPDGQPINPADFQRYTDVLQEQFGRLNPESRHAIGIWSNPRMVLDTWWGTNESLLTSRPELYKEFLDRLYLLEQETVIDVIRDVSELRRRTDDIFELMAELTVRGRHAGLTELGIDPVLLDAKGQGGLQAFRRGIDKANEALGINMPYDDLLLKADDPRAIFTGMSKHVDTVFERIEAIRGDSGYADWILEQDSLRTKSATEDALGVLRSYNLAGLDDAVDDLARTYVFRDAEMRLLESVADTFTEGRAGERTFRAVLRAAQMADESGTSYRKLGMLYDVGDESGIMVAAQNWLHNHLLISERAVPGMGELPDLSRAGPMADVIDELARLQEMIADPSIPDLIGPEPDLLERTRAAQISDVLPDARAVKPALRRRHAEIMDMLDPRRAVPTITTGQVEDVFGSVLPTRVRDILANVLDGTELSAQMLEDIHRGISISGEGGMIELPPAVQRALLDAPDDVASVIPTSRGVYSGLDSRTIIRRSKDGVMSTLGQLLYDRSRATDLAVQKSISDDIVQALVGFQDVMEGWAADTDMPDRLRDYVIRSMERRHGTAPGGAVGEVFEAAKEISAKRAAKAAEHTEMSRGFMNMFRELSQTRGGRGIMYGVAAVASIGVIDMVRKKDRTINEMQGPEFLPGGNPYTNDPNSGGFTTPQQMTSSPPSYPAGNPASGGVTYQIRTRGGNYDSDFINDIQSITGGEVNGTTYDSPTPFQSANVRERVLRMYG